MKAYVFELVQNTGAHKLIAKSCKCGAFSCQTDLAQEQQFYREQIQTDMQAAPSFNYFCVRCGEKARRNLKFY